MSQPNGIIVMVMVMIVVLILVMVMVAMMVTSSVSEPKRRRSKGMAATRSIMNQPLINKLLAIWKKFLINMENGFGNFQDGRNHSIFQWAKTNWVNWSEELDLTHLYNWSRQSCSRDKVRVKSWWRIDLNSFPSNQIQN